MKINANKKSADSIYDKFMLIFFLPLIVFIIIDIFGIILVVLYLNILGIVYEIIGFLVILLITRSKTKFTKENLEAIQEHGYVEIDSVTNRKYWAIGIILVMTGITFQLFSALP